MKIHKDEIDAYCRSYESCNNSEEYCVQRALEAAYTVRRARKQAKREDKFKPCAIQYDGKDATEIMLSDEPAVWYDAKSHVEIAYNFDGLMIGVRLWNVAAKRERQRKEKDKQVVESVKPHLAPYYGDGSNAGPEFVPSPKATASKAPEWDGTFGCGLWKMANGEKAQVLAVRENELIGNIGDKMQSWRRHGGVGMIPGSFDLIRPWPKGEQ